MTPKVSLIHTRLGEFPSNHEKMIREANEASAYEKAISANRSVFKNALQTQDFSFFDEYRTRADFIGRMNRVIEELKIPGNEIMLAIGRREIDNESTWADMEALTLQIFLWIHTYRLRNHGKTKAKLTFSENPHEQFLEFDQAIGIDKALFEKSFNETASRLGYPNDDFQTIHRLIRSRVLMGSFIRKYRV